MTKNPTPNIKLNKKMEVLLVVSFQVRSPDWTLEMLVTDWLNCGTVERKTTNSVMWQIWLKVSLQLSLISAFKQLMSVPQTLCGSVRKSMHVYWQMFHIPSWEFRWWPSVIGWVERFGRCWGWSLQWEAGVEWDGCSEGACVAVSADHSVNSAVSIEITAAPASGSPSWSATTRRYRYEC